MSEPLAPPATLEQMIGHWLRIVALGIEVMAAAVIVGGLAWSTAVYDLRIAAAR